MSPAVEVWSLNLWTAGKSQGFDLIAVVPLLLSYYGSLFVFGCWVYFFVGSSVGFCLFIFFFSFWSMVLSS